MRLDKFLTNALDISRSDAIRKIKEKKVIVNDKTIDKKDFKIDEAKDIIKVDNKTIEYREFVYYMLNKPKGYISATKDNINKTVISLIDSKKDIFPVGRLDKDTEGLLLITNDGKYAHQLTSPTKGVIKKYYVECKNKIKQEDVKTFLNGMYIKEKKQEEYFTRPARLEILTDKSAYVYISEGKFHEIKKMFEKNDNEVLYLKRIAMGAITLDENLKVGEYRELTPEEIDLFKSYSIFPLQTNRLILRPFLLKDLNDFHEYIVANNLKNEVENKQNTLMESKDELEKCILEKNTFAIFSKEDNKVIGMVGLFDMQIDNNNDNSLLLRCYLSKEYWNKGILREAYKKIIEYSFLILQVKYIWVEYSDLNLHLKGVIEESGFSFLKSIKQVNEYKGYDIKKKDIYTLYNPYSYIFDKK